MIFYTLFIFLFVMLAANYRLSCINDSMVLFVQKSRLYLAILLVICVSIFRFDVGYDYSEYYRMVYPSLDEEVERFEPLSRLICYVVYYLKWPPALFIIFGLLAYYFYFSTLRRYSGNLYFALLAFIAFVYTTDFGNIRQGIAVAICFWGYRYICSKSLIKYLLVCFVASLFHATAVVAIPIYFVYNYFNTFYCVLFTVILLAGFNVLMAYLSDLNFYANYLEVLDEFEGGDKKKYTNVLWLFLMVLIDFLGRKNRENASLYFVIWFGILVPFLLGGHFGGRISRYYLVYLCLLIPKSLSHSSLLVRNVVCIGLIAYFLLLLYINSQGTGSMVPYQSIFSIDYQNPHFRIK